MHSPNGTKGHRIFLMYLLDIRDASHPLRRCTPRVCSLGKRADPVQPDPPQEPAAGLKKWPTRHF